MATIGNIRGMLLEEIVLHLLSKSGYRVVDLPGVDPTLKSDRGSLWVKGRGEWHQADAIADYNFSPPFSFPQRLLVEAKCLKSPVELSVIRGGVGLQKDVSEFFVPDLSSNDLQRNRYHYQMGIFSANGFSKPSQNYAYAHDIYLLDLGVGPLSRAIDILNQLERKDFPDELDLSQLRAAFRNFLRDGPTPPRIPLVEFRAIKTVAQNITFVCIAMVGGVFPIFLIPANSEVFEKLRTEREIICRIHIVGTHFEIRQQNHVLFYFRIPEFLFKRCFDNGEFDQAEALSLKEQYLSVIEILIFQGNVCKKITLKLDGDWLRSIRQRI